MGGLSIVMKKLRIERSFPSFFLILIFFPNLLLHNLKAFGTTCNEGWYQRNSTYCRERWITKQIMFRYGKWYITMIECKGGNFSKKGPNIYLKNGFGDPITVKSLLLADLFDNNGLKKKISNPARIRDLLHLIFTTYGDIGENIYFPLTWEDNVLNHKEFIFGFNRYYNSSATVLFPLVGYHNPNNFKFLFPPDNNITFWNLSNELIWRGATSGYIHGNQGRMRQSSRLGKAFSFCPAYLTSYSLPIFPVPMAF